MSMRGRKTRSFSQWSTSWYIAALYSLIIKQTNKKRALLQPINLFLVLKWRILACKKPQVPGNIGVYYPKPKFLLDFFYIIVLTKIFKTFHFYQSAIYGICNSTSANHMVYMPHTYPY